MLHSVLPSTIQWGAVTVCPPPQLCGCSLGGHTGAATVRQICAMCSSAMHIWKQPWSHRAFSHFIKQPRGKNCFQTWVCSLKPAYIHATVSRRYFKKGISRGQLVTWQQNYLTLLKNQAWLNEKKKPMKPDNIPLSQTKIILTRVPSKRWVTMVSFYGSFERLESVCSRTLLASCHDTCLPPRQLPGWATGLLKASRSVWAWRQSCF